MTSEEIINEYLIISKILIKYSNKEGDEVLDKVREFYRKMTSKEMLNEIQLENGKE